MRCYVASHLLCLSCDIIIIPSMCCIVSVLLYIELLAARRLGSIILRSGGDVLRSSTICFFAHDFTALPLYLVERRINTLR